MSIQSIALVDASHRFSVNFHAQADSLGPNSCVDVTMRELESIRDYAQHVIICVDRGPYWRHQVFPEYKAGRERRPEYPQLYDEFMNKLNLAGFPIAGAKGFEADDVMATLACAYHDQCADIRLVTEDKDALQLLTDRVSVHCWRARGEFEVRGLLWLSTYAKMGAAPKTSKSEAQPAVTPAQVPLLQAIMGDKSDNIRGVDGIGPVQGGALVRKFWKGDPLRTIAAITDYCTDASMAAKVPALITKWLAGCGEVGRWVQLTTLRMDVPLDPVDLLQPRERHPQVIEVGEDGAPVQFPIEPDETLEGIFDEILADEPSAEDLAAEAAEMAGRRPAEELISAPPAQVVEFSWLQFKTLLGGQRAVNLAGIAETSEYAQELLGKFRENLTKSEDNGTPYTPLKAAGAAYALTKTPAEKRLIGALPDDHNAKKAVDKRQMSDLADVVLPLPKEPAASARPSATSAPVTLAITGPALPAVPPKAADPKAPSVDAPTQPAAGVSTATEKAPGQPEPTSAQAATPAAGAAPRSEVVPSSQGPRAPLPGQRVEKSIDESALGIVAYPAPSWALSCEPASAGHAITIATRLWGKIEFLKAKFPNPEAMAFTILHGRNLGLGLAISLMEIWVIRGRPSCSSRLISALAQQDPNHEYTQMVELTDTFCRVLIKDKRMKDPTPWTYSIAEAEALQLTRPSPKGEKSQWVLRPKTMLLKTPAAIGHRFMFPGRVLGLTPLELEPEGQHLVTE